MMSRIRGAHLGQQACVAMATLLLGSTSLWAQTELEGQQWKQRIEGAKSGSTVTLPAGRFRMKGVKLPAGIALRGAGYLQTIIDASGGGSGLEAAKGSQISALTVRGATAAGISVEGASDVLVSGVRVEKCMTGLVLRGSDRLTLQNSVLYSNRTGLAGSASNDICLVNNTLYNNNSLGISLTNTSRAAVFNNVVANSATGLYLDGNRNLQLDYNLYLANYIGKIPKHPGPTSVQSWRDLVKQDAHSLQAVVAFTQPENGIFIPSTRLTWAPGRAPTSGFGTPSLGKWKAPQTDISGQTRRGATDIGAVHLTALKPSQPPAGTLEVTQPDAIVSAGLYTPGGVLVNYLFQNLPLKPGKHPYWLPARDWQGKPIAPGAYEIRAVESKVRMTYKGLVFNNASSSHKVDHNTLHAEFGNFTTDNRLLMSCGWSESGLQIRSFDSEYEKAGWYVRGASDMRGSGLDANDNLFVLTALGKDKKSGKDIHSLMKVRALDGAILPITPEQPAPSFTGVMTPTVDGIAALGTNLYVSDPQANKVLIGEASKPTFAQAIDVEAPRQICADSVNNLLWLISGTHKLLALSPRGEIVASREFPHALDKLSVNNGRLALLSRETGKVERFGITNPQQLVSTLTVGTGEAPSGKFSPTKFTFKGMTNQASVALGRNGELFVVDNPRTMYFSPGGVLKKQTIAVWGQHLVNGKLPGDSQLRWWNVNASYSMTMDSRSNSWAPDGLWTYAQKDLARDRTAVGFFSDKGRTFATFLTGRDPVTLTLVEFDEAYRGKTLATWYADKADDGNLVRRTDSNSDGVVDGGDAPALPVTGKSGGRVKIRFPNYSYMDPEKADFLFADSGIRYSPASVGQMVTYAGLDGGGIPVWDWEGARNIEAKMPDATNKFVSPFDLKSPETTNNNVGEFHPFSDGSVAFTASTKSGGGSGFAHVAGSDMAATGPDGNLRWVHPLPLTAGVHGVQIVNDILVTQDFTDMDWLLFNKDGLSLGISGIPQEMHWTGMWNDHHKQFRLYKGNDGEVYALLGDYTLTAFHHFKLTGSATIRHTKTALKITPATAAVLATWQPQPVPARVEPPTFKVTIKKLETSLAIDGDLQKWRTAGVDPQIIITPETAGGGVQGPADISGVVRLAHENGNLYVQVIKFDDVVTMHQPLEKHYMQDSVEFCINSFLNGFKFNVTRTQQHGDTVFRDRFYETKYDRVYSAEQVPRSIRVLDNAESVSERTLIESIYGLDLSRSKVIVTEFKLPMELAFEGDAKSGPTGKSGDTMWIGIMLDDNDVPGSDVQDLLVYPATYNTFALKERGCLATFE